MTSTGKNSTDTRSHPPRSTPQPKPKKERLEELIALAQAYRGWSLKDVAQSLGRDPHKLVPESGIPKLDLVIRLAELLDWSVDQVARDLCDLSEIPVEPSTPDADFRSLDKSAFEAYGQGRFDEVERISREALRVAQTPNERARALMRLCAAHDARGLYGKALQTAQQGLREVEASPEFHLSFRINLANAHYTLGNNYEAEALANSLVEWFATNPLPSPLSRSTKAFAYYVRGSCHRCFCGLAMPNTPWHAQRAHEDLTTAERLFVEYAAQTGHDTYGGYANICRGAALEVAPLNGTKSPDEVLDQVVRALDEALGAGDREAMPRGAWLESWGWWCIFGCNVAMRQIADRGRLGALMGTFLRQADLIAEKLGNWALRERVWTLELERRRCESHCSTSETGEPGWTVTDDEIRIVTGTMARFPVFREVGWQVLRTARRAEG